MRGLVGVFSGLAGLVVGGTACGGKAGSPPSATSADVASEVESVAARDGGAGPDGESAAEGMGTLTLAGGAPVGELVLEPLGADGQGDTAGAVRPDAKGRVKAGIYKVPGGSWIAVPEGGTVHVRPDERRGIMIGGLPFQLDTDVKLVAESDPESLSFPRDAALLPDKKELHEPRHLATGEPLEGAALLQHRGRIQKLVLETDVSADARGGYLSALASGRAGHFHIDFDGTLYQSLDVSLAAPDAEESSHDRVSVRLNNWMPNLLRTPAVKAHPPVLPEGASPTPPAGAVAPDGPCKLAAGALVCDIGGHAFGLDHGALVVGRDGAWTSADAEYWSPMAMPPLTVHGVRVAGGDYVAFGAGGKVARSEDAATWRAIDTGVGADWRDAWVSTTDLSEGRLAAEPLVEDGEAIVVLVGDGGAIARSTDSGETFTRIASGFAGNLEAISQSPTGRLIARGGDRAIVSLDGGASWSPLDEALDLQVRVPAPGMGRCLGRLPVEGEVCAFWHSFQSLGFVEAFVKVGELGLAYTRRGYAITQDGGLSFESAVTAARAEELAKYERPVSEAKTINSAKVMSFGYTEAQYEALGSLARLLANVFPALKRVAAFDEEGEVIDRALEVPALASGVLGNWHLKSNHWDPGPGLDWERLARDLAEPAR